MARDIESLTCLCGMNCFALCFVFREEYLGFHIYAFAASFILFAFVNVANHSKFDITFNFFGPIGYQVR